MLGYVGGWINFFLFVKKLWGAMVPSEVGWTKVVVGRVSFFASVNYRGNVVVTDDVGIDGQRKELVTDLEYGVVVVQ